MKSLRLWIVVVAVLAIGLVVIWVARDDQPAEGKTAAPRPSVPLSYVGSAECAGCHESQHREWEGSHHDLAMQEANESTVLGNFDEASFRYYDIESFFYKEDDKFFVRTDGPDGSLQAFAIDYVFGVSPLQQYLIGFPDGRYQTLSIAWDTRPENEGGQRWFHLYPDEFIDHTDELHWTKLSQNWNFMCAECHSTDLEKNYDLDSNTFDTAWAEIDVSCEACHGPGSRHIAWAEMDESDETSSGLVVDLTDDSQWLLEDGLDIATRHGIPPETAQIETCARCHSRRRVIDDDYVHGEPLLQTHVPVWLEPRLYHADGQIDDEVYVYGSFLQSKMYHAGVVCSDCHEPHSLSLHAPGNAVCARCHRTETFDTPDHHFHDSTAECVDCHMPSKVYMQVDPRRDHSFRVPRPDLSVSIDTPNACNQCHEDRSPEWAANTLRDWYGLDRPERPHYGETLYRGQGRGPGVERELAALAIDSAQPDIVRASALSLLDGYTSADSFDAIQQGLGDEDPLVRVAALDALRGVDPERRFRLANRLLDDPVHAVRITAARVLAGTPPEAMTPNQRAKLDRVIKQYIDAQLVNAEQPSAHLNIGAMLSEHGQIDQAERAYRQALRLDPGFVPAYVNLADVYRVRREDDRGEELLRQALAIAPDDAGVHFALGLLLVRQARSQEALESFATAADLAPSEARYVYTYGVALNSLGQPDRAIDILAHAHEQHPYNAQILFALVAFNRDRGEVDEALVWAERLVRADPYNAQAQALVEELRAQQSNRTN